MSLGNFYLAPTFVAKSMFSLGASEGWLQWRQSMPNPTVKFALRAGTALKRSPLPSR